MNENLPSDRSRAWRFEHPDFDGGQSGPGIVIDPVGRIALTTESQTVRQAILLLLSTSPGERLRRPLYGCALHRLVFSPNDETTHGLAMHYIDQALTRWEPRIELIELDARRDPEAPQIMQVSLRYRLRRTQEHEQLTFALDLQASDE